MKYEIMNKSNFVFFWIFAPLSILISSFLNGQLAILASFIVCINCMIFFADWGLTIEKDEEKNNGKKL